MNSFKAGEIDALISMKVLDEGVDVPPVGRQLLLLVRVIHVNLFKGGVGTQEITRKGQSDYL